MEERIITFSANQQSLIKTGGISHYASDTVSYIKAIFDLGENWTGFDEVRAVFKTPYDTRVAVLNSLGECEVPHEILMLKAEVRANLVGSIYTEEAVIDRLTTYSCEALEVDEDVPVEGGGTVTPSPSEYEGFVAKVKNDADRAEASATDADASAQASEQSADDSARSAQASATSAQSAHDDKIAIEEAIAEVIQQIEGFEQVQVVVNTLPPTSQATSDFTDGVLTLGIPQGVKGDTGNGIQSIAKTGTSGLVDTYTITFTDGQTTTFTVTNGAKGDTGNGISSIAKTSTVGLVDTYTITYTNGTTTTFTVTNGEKGDKGDTGEVSLSELEDATIVQTLSDTEPYHFRRTNNGLGSGHREYDEIVGASVGWNQIFIAPYSQTTYGITFTRDEDRKTISISGTATATIYRLIQDVDKTITGHVYYVDRDTTNTNIWIYNDSGGVKCATDKATIGKATASKQWFIRVTNGATVDETIVPQVIDLTLFNSTIADYVHTLEQSTAGSGVTWLKTHFPKLFDNGYQPFDNGSIQSVSGLSAHEMVGKNLLHVDSRISGTIAGVSYTSDDNFLYLNGTKSGGGYARLTSLTVTLPAGTYYARAIPMGGTASSTDISVYLCDSSNNTDVSSNIKISEKSFTLTETKTLYVLFAIWNDGVVFNNYQIGIVISMASGINDFEPYESHTYPLDSSVTLRGKYVLDNGQLKAVGDVWKSVGSIERNWAEVDLGDLTYNDNGNNVFWAVLAEAPTNTGTDNMPDMVCSKYVTVTSRSSGAWGITTEDKVVSLGYDSARVYLRDTALSDASAVSSALSGVKLAFRKKTPTTEQAIPYNSPQWCDANGTEEYVGSELPVGHNTQYPMTLIDTADGLSNGTYEPRITVASGKKTVTWVSV